MSRELGLEAAGFPPGFHENDEMRSRFMRRLILHDAPTPSALSAGSSAIPKTLVRFWHAADAVPADVQRCLQSWEVLRRDGFEIATFNDVSASSYISAVYDAEHIAAFERCSHPAMRSDYFRLCYLVASGGFYVDADDVLTDGLWGILYADDRLKLQPLCYDIPTGEMVPGTELWDADAPEAGRIYYVNNNPLVAPPSHPVLQKALKRATGALLNEGERRDIQSVTGPGNLTAVLAAHAHELALAARPQDFALLRRWDLIGRTQWDLSYRADDRNWRNVDWSQND